MPVSSNFNVRKFEFQTRIDRNTRRVRRRRPPCMLLLSNGLHHTTPTKPCKYGNINV